MALTNAEGLLALVPSSMAGTVPGAVLVEISPIIAMSGASVTFTSQFAVIYGAIPVFSSTTPPTTASAPPSVSYSGSVITVASSGQAAATSIFLVVFGRMEEN